MEERDKLIEYLCAVQHEVFEVESHAHRSAWAAVPADDKISMRASMAAVLRELESLGTRLPHVHHSVTR